MSFFDRPMETQLRFCEQCQKDTEHARGDEHALLTCRDPKHVHPPKEDCCGPYSV